MKKQWTVKKTTDKTSEINTLNTPYLLIVESPSKCDKIEKYLGFQYKCISSKGHIRQLSKIRSKKENYTPEYDIIKGKMSHVNYMRSIIVQFNVNNIFMGTDDDREGEAIAWHICQVFGLDVIKTKRVIFHEITKKALQYAVQNPTLLRMNIVRAQQTRQILDRMIGFKISPFLTKLLVHNSSDFLSAGRCQTSALRLVYENELENDKKEKDVLEYSVTGTFFTHPSTVQMTLDTQFDCTTNKCMLFLEESKKFSHIVSMSSPTVKKKSPPIPFNTSKLLQAASSQLQLSPKMTMAHCQSLYQNGYITYMRTESTKYADTFLVLMKEFLVERYTSDKYIGDLDAVINKDNSNPHEAIRITDLTCETINDGDVKLKALYHLIRMRTIESCMSPYIAEHINVSLAAPMNCRYNYDLEIGHFLGWKRTTMAETDFLKEQEKRNGRRLHFVSQIGKHIPYQRIVCTVVSNEKPRHYTEAGLIQKLEDIGIGRPSTFSMLIETIKERKYVVKEDTPGETFECNEYTLLKIDNDKINVKTVNKTFGAEKNKLIIQDLGKKVVCQLVDHFTSIFSFDYTKKMESELDDMVRDVSKDGVSICTNCDEEIQKCKTPLEKKMRHIYEINEECSLVFGTNGAYIRYNDKEKSNRSVNPNIDIDFAKLERKEYRLNDLLEISDDYLGVYEGKSLYLKKGQHGAYAEWGDKKQSFKYLGIKKHIGELTFEEIVKILEELKMKKVESNKGILRILTEDISIRTGKYGTYVYYCTTNMKKPDFFSLKKFRGGFMTCEPKVLLEWVESQKKESRV
jgi:DNA topoisomerase I